MNRIEELVDFEEQPDGSMKIVPKDTAAHPVPRQCPSVLRTGNDLDYQCEGYAGHPGAHRAWGFSWGDE